MDRLLDVFVPGHPKTKGSLDAQRTGGKTRMVENVAGSATWRKLMAQQFRRAWTRDPLTGPVRVSAVFYLPCARGPASLIARQSGDVDKLTRNLLDALAVDETDKGLGAGVIANDSQVVGVVVEKAEASAQYPQGVKVSVWAV